MSDEIEQAKKNVIHHQARRLKALSLMEYLLAHCELDARAQALLKAFLEENKDARGASEAA